MRFIRTAAVATAGIGLVVGVPALAYTAPFAHGISHNLTLTHARTHAHPPLGDAVRHRPGWTWPLTAPHGASKPTVVRGFQPSAERWQTGHRGVDLLGSAGQEVLAAGAGTVSFAGPLFGRPVVAIDHTSPGRDTLRTTYEPVDAAVKVGQKVKDGEIVGHISADAALPGIGHCPPRVCLHWGLVRGFGHDERYLDPAGLVGRPRVRLLPVWRR